MKPHVLHVLVESGTQKILRRSTYDSTLNGIDIRNIETIGKSRPPL